MSVQTVVLDAEHPDYTFIRPWVSMFQHVREQVLAEKPAASEQEHLHQCEKKCLLTSLENLKTFSFVRDAVEGKRLRLHAWYFDLTDHELYTYHAGHFAKLADSTV